MRRHGANASRSADALFVRRLVRHECATSRRPRVPFSLAPPLREVQPTSICHETERLGLVIAIREHPEWSLADLLDRVEEDDAHAAVLRRLTIRELMHDPGVAVARVRLVRARRSTGVAFDNLVLDVLIDRWPQPVAAFELRAQLGGPRWKRQAALGRLVAAGMATRTGNTCDARYTAVRAP